MYQKDLISREHVIDVIRVMIHDPDQSDEASTFGCMVLNAVSKMPAVDAVPVVRCKDCVFWMDRHVLLPDGTRRPYAPGEESVTVDVGINCGARCMRAAEYLGGNGPFCKAGDFCSRGERKDDEEA